MINSRLWLQRTALAYGLLLFTFLAWLYIVEPLAHIERFGISSTGSPESINFLRVGPGAMFLSMTLAALYGLIRPAKMLSALYYIVILNGCIVAARLYGIAIDGVSELQITELRDEGLSWLFFVAALVAGSRGGMSRRE